MILALLGGGEVGYAAAAVPLRAAYYAGSLGGAGMAFFALLFGDGLDAADAARLRRWTAGAALLGILAGLGACIAHVGALTGGETHLDPEVWGMVAASRAGAAYSLGGAGLVLVALLALGPRWAAVAAAGGLVTCASGLLLGHTTEGAAWDASRGAPRVVLAGLLLVHLLLVAFWIGSLPPLAWAAGRGGPAAGRLMERWARLAAVAVPVLVAAGTALAWLLLGGWRPLVASRYGWALLAKVGLVAGLLGLSAWHRWRLTPALVAGVPGAGRRLRRSIVAEAAIALLVLHAAAEMVAASPGEAAEVRTTANGNGLALIAPGW